MKLIIAGGRRLAIPTHELNRIITQANYKPDEVVSGGAQGIDFCGEVWAAEHQIKCTVFTADWDTHGKAAGPIRNSQMAEYGDALLALPGQGPGTWDMIRKMIKAGKPVYVFDLSKGRPLERHELL